MKSIEQLKKFYETELLSSLEVMEDKRKKLFRKFVITFVVYSTSISLTVLILLLANNAYTHFSFILLGVALPLGLPFLICGTNSKSYVSGFKQLMIGKLVKFIDDSLIYNVEGGIDQPTFMLSKLIRTEPDKYYCDDLVKGTIGRTRIRFCELHAYYESGSRKNKRKHLIFKGLFFVGSFNKHFSCQTFVLPDNAEKLLGRFGQKFQAMKSNRGQLIKMEDPEFEKHFVVYGSDQIGARYVLSTSLMSRIVNFKSRTKYKIYLSFVDSKVLVAIPRKKNLFEPRLFRTMLGFEPIQEYFEDLQLAIGIVEDLNLNRRIWTKQ